jgi:hypothetical protein
MGLAAPRASAAASVPSLRAVDESFLFVPPGGDRLVETLTLNRDLSPALLRVALGEKLRIGEWPVSPGVRHVVTLERHDVYAADAKIVKIVPEGEIEVPRSRWAFFWGNDDEGESRIVVSVDPDNGSLRAMTISDGGVSELTPLGGPSRQHRLAAPAAEMSGAALPPSWTCGQETLPPTPSVSAMTPAAAFVRPEASESLTKSAVVAIDTDNEYMLGRFNNDTTAAVNYIASLFANVNVIYERDVSLHIFQGYTILRVSTVADPYTQSGTGNAASPKLNEFSSYWSTHYGGVKRTLAAILSGKQGSSNSASGIAWIGGLCSSSVGYSFNQLFKINYLAGDSLIFGHEVGHNFGSPHTHCYSPPVDNCYNQESNCYSGATSCPSPQTINGVTNVTGTLMGYCHLLSGCNTALVFHPRTMSEYFNSHITAASSCIFNVGGSLPAGPTVAGINPPSGSISGGTSVTITGSNFSATPKVAFVDLTGSVSLTVGTTSAGSITATTPAHAAGAMDVVVMNSDYQTGTLRNGFTYGAVATPPTVSAVTPSFGPTGGGTLATIVGTNFQNGATVSFGGVAAAGVAVVNSTTITATTPANAAGSVTVAVTNPGPQTGSLANGFAYQNGTDFYTLTPCRVIDTRTANGPLGGPALAANADRVFTVTGQCGIPSTARAISVNITVTGSTAAGDLRLYTAGGAQPVSNTINYSSGQTRANNMVAPVGSTGGVAVHCDQPSGTVQFILDVNGYFQ